jgi:hypothetical protein
MRDGDAIGSGRVARWGAAAAWGVGLVLACGGPLGARAERDAVPAPFAIPVVRGVPALGAGYDAKLGTARGDPGACVADVGTERVDAPAVHYSLATLTRAGGRLVLGVHVAAVKANETLASPRLTDAARRLGQSDTAAFRDLCGDGYVARVELGGQWLAEIEVDPGDVVRAGPRVTTGTWSDVEPFRAALEYVTKNFAITARELPEGSRADAHVIEPAALVERAIGFPATVDAEHAKPFVAVFQGYEKGAFSGVVLSQPDALDDREVADRVFRSGAGAPATSAASRAAEMRLAQAHHYDPAQEGGEPIRLSNASLGKPEDPLPDGSAPPAAPVASSEGKASPPPVASTGPSAGPVVHKQAALVFEGGGPPVYATTRAPGGVHAEHVRERFYWVPGMAEATPAVRTAIDAAKGGSPVRGTTVEIVDVGPIAVVLTDAPPAAGVYSEPVGERRAWIAGVAAPDPAQRAALDAAIRAEGAPGGARQ